MRIIFRVEWQKLHRNRCPAPDFSRNSEYTTAAGHFFQLRHLLGRIRQRTVHLNANALRPGQVVRDTDLQLRRMNLPRLHHHHNPRRHRLGCICVQIAKMVMKSGSMRRWLVWQIDVHRDAPCVESSVKNGLQFFFCCDLVIGVAFRPLQPLCHPVARLQGLVKPALVSHDLEDSQYFLERPDRYLS